MASKLIYTTILLAIAKLTIQTPLENPGELNINNQDLSQLIKLLQNNGVSPNHEKQHRDKHHHHDDGDLNIQKLNLYIKRSHNNNYDLVNQDVDRICKKTGRCGCSGGRCGPTRTTGSLEVNADSALGETLEKLLSNRDNDPTSCGNGRCGLGTNRDDVKSTFEVDLKQDLEKYGKKYKINEDLDAIVLDFEDMMKPERCFGPNCIPIKRSDRTLKLDNLLGKKQYDLDKLLKKSDLEGVIIEIDDGNEDQGFKNDLKLSEERDLKYSRPVKNSVQISPDDLYEYYGVYKYDLIRTLLRYIKNPSNDRQDIASLPNKQQNLLDNLKFRVLSGTKLTDSQLSKLLQQIIFGDQSHSNVLPHSKNNDNVYVPKWLYESLVESLKQKYLRANKSLLPLTQQQKLKMKSKDKTMWRRGLGQNTEQYGVPFELNFQGLGQAVPYK